MTPSHGSSANAPTNSAATTRRLVDRAGPVCLTASQASTVTTATTNQIAQ